MYLYVLGRLYCISPYHICIYWVDHALEAGSTIVGSCLTRFTDNKTHGRMHFVPPERTYLKLHNPNKLTVQEMQVDIVNSDEKVVKDLQAHTYVALHIR